MGEDVPWHQCTYTHTMAEYGEDQWGNPYRMRPTGIVCHLSNVWWYLTEQMAKPFGTFQDVVPVPILLEHVRVVFSRPVTLTERRHVFRRGDFREPEWTLPQRNWSLENWE